MYTITRHISGTGPFETPEADPGFYWAFVQIVTTDRLDSDTLILWKRVKLPVQSESFR